MTKKDYIKFATVFSIAKNKGYDLETVIKEFCLVLKADNPAFNRERFLEACGIKEE